MSCEYLQREIPTTEGEKVLVGCRQLAASKALDLHFELIGKFGQAIFPFIEGKHNFSDIIYLMQVGSKDPSANELLRRVVCEAVVEGTTVTPALFDIKYGNNLMQIFNTFGFVLEANFLDFFKEGLALNEQRRLEAEEALRLAKQKSSSPEST